ncbi:hypothetical protein KHQ81_15665 (plasmid) [Mycoplasmatota bacterium]|nr:hypothetical protein KHQ81_15665 [Mycoplasmatota bacterium]
MEQVNHVFQIIFIVLLSIIAIFSVFLILFLSFYDKKSERYSLLTSILVVGTTVGVLGSVLYLMLR